MQGLIFPDAEAAWIYYLGGRLVVPVTNRVLDKRGENDELLEPRFMRVLRAGGNRFNKMIDMPQMIFECYGEFDDEASQLAREARAHVHAAEGLEIAPGVFCKTLTDVTGPSNIQDEQPNRSRYSFTVMTGLRAETVPDLADLEGQP